MEPGNIGRTGVETGWAMASTEQRAGVIWAPCRPQDNGCNSVCPPARSAWKAALSTAWPSRSTGGEQPGMLLDVLARVRAALRPSPPPPQAALHKSVLRDWRAVNRFKRRRGIHAGALLITIMGES